MAELTVDDYNIRIGTIVINLQSLETTIRFFFFRKNGETEPFPKAGSGDDYVPHTSLTAFCQLRKWIRKYNGALSEKEVKEYKISENNADVRDAIAHARLIAPDPPSLPYTMWRFGEPVDGKVQVKMCQILSKDWLDQTIKSIYADQHRVIGCFKARGYKGMG